MARGGEGWAKWGPNGTNGTNSQLQNREVTGVLVFAGSRWPTGEGNEREFDGGMTRQSVGSTCANSVCASLEGDKGGNSSRLRESCSHGRLASDGARATREKDSHCPAGGARDEHLTSPPTPGLCAARTHRKPGPGGRIPWSKHWAWSRGGNEGGPGGTHGGQQHWGP